MLNCMSLYLKFDFLFNFMQLTNTVVYYNVDTSGQWAVAYIQFML